MAQDSVTRMACVSRLVLQGQLAKGGVGVFSDVVVLGHLVPQLGGGS